MEVSQVGSLPSAGCAFDKSLLDKERLIDLFNGSGIIAHSCGNGGDTHGTAVELIDDGEQYLVVNLIKPVPVNVECFERVGGDLFIYLPVSLHLCEVTHTAQQCIGDTWCTTAA